MSTRTRPLPAILRPAAQQLSQLAAAPRRVRAGGKHRSLALARTTPGLGQAPGTPCCFPGRACYYCHMLHRGKMASAFRPKVRHMPRYHNNMSEAGANDASSMLPHAGARSGCTPAAAPPARACPGWWGSRHTWSSGDGHPPRRSPARGMWGAIGGPIMHDIRALQR